MKQTKSKSAIEAITNTVAGLVTSFLIQIMIYPILNIDVTFGENIIITLVFFVASFGRSYIIRRLFDNMV